MVVGGVHDVVSVADLSHRQPQATGPLIGVKGHVVVALEPASYARRVEAGGAQVAVCPAARGLFFDVAYQSREPFRRGSLGLHRRAPEARSEACREGLARAAEKLDVLALGLPRRAARPAKDAGGPYAEVEDTLVGGIGAHVKKFPEWVPQEVIEYYRYRLEPKEYTDEYEQLGTDTLCRVMEAESMKKAWQAIAKRSEIVHPGFFAAEIPYVVRAAELIPTYPPPEQIATFRKLTSKVQALSQEFEDALGHWADEVMLHYFGVRPDKAIHELADNMEQFTRMLEDGRKALTVRTGKPGVKHAKRNFVIRLLLERVNELYGQPLHDTVAAISGVILDEYVDPETVRSIHRNPIDY